MEGHGHVPPAVGTKRVFDCARLERLVGHACPLATEPGSCANMLVSSPARSCCLR